MPPSRSNFDHIARPYRWLEYLTLGRALERCRFHFLPQLADRRRALVLGDGDGRFLAKLMAQNSTLAAVAVDTSAAMLDLLRNRCDSFASSSESRLQTHNSDALSYLEGSSGHDFDLVVTHFFIDCLTQAEVDVLAAAIAMKVTQDALWLISDFRIPEGGMRLPARALVSLLYLAFRLLTGLRVTRLPDHKAALTQRGFARVDHHSSLWGILTTELWLRGAYETHC